jgi:hypothetical protein
VENLYKSPSGYLSVGDAVQNSVKAATDIPEIGRTVEKTTVTRVLPVDPLTGERKTPDYFEYVAKLSAADWERHPKHTLYIYRRNTDTGPMVPLERLNGIFPTAGGDISLSDREEFEIALAQKYGGGNYRLILKKGSERITEGRISFEGPPKNTRPGILDSAEANSNGASSQAPETTESVAKTAMNIVANQESQGLQIGMAALHSAADVVQRLANPQTGAAGQSETDLLMKQALIEMLRKALNPPPPPPPPDPIAMFQQFATLMATLSGGNSAVSPIVQQILDAGLKRVLDPPPSGPVSSTGAELVRVFPQVAAYASEAVKEWRAGSEAQLQTAQIMANANRPALPPGTAQPPPPGRPITQATQLAPAVPPAPAEVQTMPAGTPSLEFIEGKIVEILKKPISADDCADEVLSFLDLMDPGAPGHPGMVDQLAACSEAQLVQLFQTRPVLRQYHDLARLQEFVRSFLKYAKETEPTPGVDTTSKPN